MYENLAFRFYQINPNVINQVNDLFNSKTHKPLLFDTYVTDSNKNIKLSFEIKKITKNDYGKSVDFYLDRILLIPIKDDKVKSELATYTYKIQSLENKGLFDNYILIFGNKTIDASIKYAIKQHITNIHQITFDPLIPMKPNFEKLQKFVNKFPNIQKFCIKDVVHDQFDDIIGVGKNLEETAEWDDYAIEQETKGDVNFLGLSVDKRVIFIKRDGSFYSREDFSQTNTIELIYNLLKKIHDNKLFDQTVIEDF